jgi:hypothetical protein
MREIQADTEAIDARERRSAEEYSLTVRPRRLISSRGEPEAVEVADLGHEAVWRLDQFVSLGFDLPRAAIMADDTRVDLAQARRLVALGCSLETASRIFL